jgi:hypothetical protein
MVGELNMANMNLTIQLWDCWTENKNIYVIFEIIDTGKLYLLKRELNDIK